MKPVIQKEQLLAVLRDNRAKHRSVFEEAVKGFFEAFEADLEEHKRRILAARVPRDIRLFLHAPEDHTADYDRIIRMVEMNTGNEIELTEQEFANFVQDNWAWKDAWLKLSNVYAAGSTQATYGTDWLED